MSSSSTRWFVNARFDLGVFHGPVWLIWLLLLALPASWRHLEVPIWVWVVAVMCIDVGHVWSTLYRTYLDRDAWATHSWRLLWLPLFCVVPAIGLAFVSEAWFWRVLAYIAVFHFIKQQVGIAMLYHYKYLQALQQPHPCKQLSKHLDKATIYAGTLGPVIHWHFNKDAVFHWFIPGDFLNPAPLLAWLVAQPFGTGILLALQILFYGLWFGIPLVWLAANIYWWRTGTAFALGKVLWIVGTWLNWYLGIVAFNSDLVFTLTNVVAHGVPYFGLIALYGTRKLSAGGYGDLGAALRSFGKYSLLICVVLALMPMFVLAFMEEWFWDFLLYREHRAFFELFWAYPVAAWEHPVLRALAVALLSLPQTVHYLLDGFIWKFNQDNPDLKTHLLGA